MKKFIFAIMVALMLPLGNADARKRNVSDMTELIREYKGHEDFEYISVGNFLLSLAKGMAKSEARGDSDMIAGLSLLDGIKHITIADYSDCRQGVKAAFTADVRRILEDMDLIMEAKSDDSTMKIYGSMNASASVLNGLVLYTPQEETVICIDGKISIDDLGAIVADAR